MKLGIKLLSICLSVVMIIAALPLAAFAAGKVDYVKEFRLSTAATEAEAKQWLLDNGYVVITTNLNKNTKKNPVFLGYKITYDPDEAITDMAVMQMNGGYSFSEYEAALKAQQEQVSDLLDSFTVAIEEYVANYRAGKKNAVAAHDMMNCFSEDDSGMLLGDFLVQYANDKEQLTKLFMQSNQNVLSYLYYMFALACTDYGVDTSWLAKFAVADPYGDYNSAEYDDVAREIFSAWEDIRSDILIGKKTFEILEEYNDAEEYRDDVGEEQMAEDLTYMNYYALLSSYTYNRKPMVEFFLQDPNEVALEDLYPLISALTPGQLECVKTIGFKPVLEYAAISDEEVAGLTDSFYSVLAEKGITGTYSVYANVDRSLFNGEGIALTSQALRESASTGEGSWYKGNVDKALETTLIAITGTAAVLGLACVARAAVIATRAHQAMTGFMAFAEQYCGWYSMAELAEFYGVPANYTATVGVGAKIAAGVCIGIALLSFAVLLAIEYYNFTHPTYDPVPRVIVDHVITDSDEYYLNYYCVRDQNGDFGDMNGWGGERWNALYVTTDKKAGNPIMANSIYVKIDSNSPDDAQSVGVHYFGESAAANVNRYSLKRTASEIYMFFKRDNSLSKTASTFSSGMLVMFTGAGLIGGVALGSLGVLGAGKLKKKKEDPDTEAAE